MPGRSVANIEAKVIDYSGPRISWVAEFPIERFPWMRQPSSPEVFAIGFHDGSFSVADSEGKRLFDGGPGLDSPAKPINGIAVSRELIALSTVNEIIFLRLSPPHGVRAVSYPNGCHGIVNSASGGFLAPRGLRGLVFVNEDNDHRVFARTFTAIDRDVNFYVVRHIASCNTGEEVYGCAGRRTGIITVPLRADHSVQSITRCQGPYSPDMEHFDIVDVTPLLSESFPFGMLALSVDNTLHFMSDAREGSPSVAVRYSQLQGTAYRILQSDGHVVLFTSEEICVIPELGHLLLENRRPGPKTRSFRYPVEALDCWIAYGDKLMFSQGSRLNAISLESIVSAASMIAEPIASVVQDEIDVLPWQASHETFESSGTLQCVG